MPVRSFRVALGLVALATVASLSATAGAATSGQNGTHDPSRIIESNGKFYFCGTGGGCAQSGDGLLWKQTGLHIPMPSWSCSFSVPIQHKDPYRSLRMLVVAASVLFACLRRKRAW